MYSCSRLNLNLKRTALDNNNLSDTSSSASFYPLSYDTSFKDALSPLKTNDTFHTATSACSDLNCNDKISNIMCDSGVDLEQNKIKNKNVIIIDESDLSSTEDYKVQSDENSAHSSSSLEKHSSCQGRRKFRSKQNYKYGYNIKHDDINTLKYLHECIARQKMLIIKNLETNCTKEEINQQISVSILLIL